MDNPVFSFFYNLADLVLINVLTFLCCVPVVTVGAAMAANHHAVQSILYKTGGSVIRTYFKKFCEFFKHATITWVVQLLVLAVLGFNMYLVLIYFDGTFRNILLVLMALFALLILAVDAFMMILIARYENTLREHFHNAMMLTMRKFLTAIALVLLKLSPAILALVTPTAFLASIPFWVLIGFSLITLVSNWLMKSTLLQLEDERDERDERDEQEEPEAPEED